MLADATDHAWLCHDSSVCHLGTDDKTIDAESTAEVLMGKSVTECKDLCLQKGCSAVEHRAPEERCELHYHKVFALSAASYANYLGDASPAGYQCCISEYWILLPTTHECPAGQHLTDTGTCDVNKCMCSEGDAPTGEDCPNHGDIKCIDQAPLASSADSQLSCPSGTHEEQGACIDDSLGCLFGSGMLCRDSCKNPLNCGPTGCNTNKLCCDICCASGCTEAGF